MADRITSDELNEILACPVPSCRAPLPLEPGAPIACTNCGERFAAHEHIVDLTPSSWQAWSPIWPVWEKLQANGLVSYTNDPDHNLGVGDRDDYLAFGRFCNFAGRVLDVGCGPQPWPTHFRAHAPGTRFVGIDPLAGDTPAEYAVIRGLGEYLPFADDTFDQVVFATSLDHMLDTVAALREARRVCRDGGAVLIWSGEKRPGAPPPTSSPAWYSELAVPEGADDPFHCQRFTEEKVRSLFDGANLRIDEHAAVPVDEWRTNHFYRLVTAPISGAVKA